MTASGGFRVIIAGGGISGLTLANALEKAGIDYVLLEARDTIAPKVGASIGFFPNGGRILDQLGCLEALQKETCALHRGRSRDKNGVQFHTNDGIRLVEARTRDRSAYDNLQDKSKIQLRKRILEVDHNETEVVVRCKDGTMVRGDVLVGCDGVHSVVRQEMWRLAHLHEQNSFDPSDKDILLAEYQCLFGISTHTEGISDGEDTVNFDKDFSTLIVGGKQRVYWFMFKRLDKVCVTEIPRYTTEDAEVFADNIKSYSITPKLTFGDLWTNKTTCTLVPTEEAQLKRWSWGRIACVGDCVHKMTPNMGAGGNAAMETAAALANELKKMVDTAEKRKPGYGNIKAHLGNYQKLRDSRLTAVLKAANGLTRMHALKTLKDRVFAFWILPNAGDFISDLQCDMITGAAKLDFLPVPERSLHGTMPFNPSQGLGQTESKLWRAVRALPFLSVTAAALYFMWGICLTSALERIGEIMEKGVQNNIGEAVHVQSLRSFYGVEFIDNRFRGLVACFASSQFVDVICSWQTLSFLTDVGVVYTILLIESARRANIMTLSYLPLILGYNMQFFGTGVLMALWCMVHYIQTPIENFRARDMRLTDLSYTASVLPVMLLTHYLPHFVSFTASVDPQTRHIANWAWQPFAVWTTILQFALKKTVMPDTMKSDRIKSPNRDLPVINYTIYSVCAISAATWWYTLYNAPFSPATLFIPNVAATKTGDEYIRLFLQFDELFSLGSCVVWLLYLFGDLKRAGMMHDSWITITGKGLVTLGAAGPGVTIGLGWLWRERLLATKWHKDAVVSGKPK